MDLTNYRNQKIELHNLFLNFIDDDNDESYFQILINLIQEQKITLKKSTLSDFINFIISISKYHHRPKNFLEKIEKTLNFLQNDIKTNFSNTQIIHVFKKNPRLLLFFVKNQIITANDIYKNLVSPKKSTKLEGKNYFFAQYFYPEIKQFLNKKDKEKIEKEFLDIDSQFLEKFEKNRLKGENDSYISQLIREDSIDEFVSFTSKNNLSLSISLKPSIFETYSFICKLKKKSYEYANTETDYFIQLNCETSLIEYAAFHGSFQIFQYLRLNNVERDQSLIIYSVHGRNPEIIHLIEEKNIERRFWKACLKEAIKCHHNEIANYILTNYLLDLDGKIILDLPKESSYYFLHALNESIIGYGFHYYNFPFISFDFEYRFLLYFACKYNHLDIVEYFLEDKKVDVNVKVYNILILFC